jgi:hypothetical protein
MHLSNRKALTIFNALKSMCNYYLQQGFQVVFIKGDGKFTPLEAWMAMVYGAPKLILASANKHVPSFICDKTTKSISRERWTVVEIKSKADYVRQGGPILVLCNGFWPVLPIIRRTNHAMVW